MKLKWKGLPTDEKAKFSSKSEEPSSSKNSDPPVLIAVDNKKDTESTSLSTISRNGGPLIFKKN